MSPRDENSQNNDSNGEHNDESTIYLIRHGDRFDYANPSWAKQAKEAGNLVTDPPLSALGYRQASETAQALKDVKASRILSSPYLRVIQTACPTAEALGVPISIEQGLAEAHATPGSVLPTPSQRFAYFPQIDTNYSSGLEVRPTPGYICPKTGFPCEAFAGAYCQRMEEFANYLETTFRGQTVVCFSHAASVALVAALLRRSLQDLKFAPCGIYQLRRHADEPFELVSSGATNDNHVSENSPTTFPWGMSEKHFSEAEEHNGKYQGSSEGIGLEYFCTTTSD